MAERRRALPIGKMTIAQIRARLYSDGYDRLVGREEEIRVASQRGALLWTPARLSTTDASQIDARPVVD